MAEEYEELDAEQKLAIARYFILSSPPGQVGEVVKDMKTLVADASTLSDEVVADIMRQYNTSHFEPVKLPGDDGARAIVSAFGEVDAASYVDPSTGKVYQVDHVEQKFVSETGQRQELGGQVGEYRKAAVSALEAYVADHYKSNKSWSAVFGDDSGNLSLVVSARNIRLRAFWAGGMYSHYGLDVSSPGKVTMTAMIKVNVHFYEDGNVQLCTDKSDTVEVEVTGDADATAKAIIKAVAQFENTFHEKLEELYGNMHSTTFKAMRRILPISGVRMNWTSGVNSLASELTG